MSGTGACTETVRAHYNKMKELSDQEFHSTFGERMIPIDFDNELLKLKTIITDLEVLEPESAYRNERNTYEHHLIKTEKSSRNTIIFYGDSGIY